MNETKDNLNNFIFFILTFFYTVFFLYNLFNNN